MKRILRASVRMGLLGLLLGLGCQTASAATLVHRYNFNEDASDLLGTAHGILVGGATLADGAVALDGSSGYVNLPNDLVTGYTSITLEAWLTDNGSGNWARLFDFGNSNAGEDLSDYGTTYVFLTVRSGGGDLRGAYTVTGGGAGEQIVYAGPSLATGVKKHLVWTSDAASATAKIYIDGVLAGVNRNVTLTPAALGPSANDWLGRSLYSADAYLNAAIDEFRIYDGALNALEVLGSYLSGPDTPGTTAPALAGIELQTELEMTINNFQTAKVLGTTDQAAGFDLTDLPGLTYTSSDTNVLAVSAQGRIVAVGLGTATVTVGYAGAADSKTIDVVAAPVELTHQYSFAADAMDTIAGADGTLMGTAQVVDGALVLDGTGSAYVDLPAGLITGYSAITFEAWASFGANGNWNRLFEFGDMNGSVGRHYVSFIPHSGNGDTRLTISDADPGYNHEQMAIRAGTLDGQGPLHIVAVLNPGQGFEAFYLDGLVGAVNTSLTIPLSAVTDAYCWLGRSLYSADAWMNGSIDEFRIYKGALSPLEIAINAAAGPDNYLADPGAFQGLRVQVKLPLELGTVTQVAVLADYANITNVNVAGLATYTLSDTNIARVSAGGALSALSLGAFTLTANFSGVTVTQALAVVHTPAPMTHRYSFDADVTDSIGGADGTLMGAAAIADGAVVLDGVAGNYVNLPNNLVTGYTAVTFEAWFTDQGSAEWARIWDLGNSSQGEDGSGTGTTYMFMAMRNGGLRGAYRLYGSEQLIDYAPRPSANVRHHVVWTSESSSRQAVLYFDGIRVGANASFTHTPAGIGQTLNDWLGRSQYNDPYFKGSIDEFRTYRGVLTPLEVATTDAAGPDSLLIGPGALTALRVEFNETMLREGIQQVRVLGDFQNVSNVLVTTVPGVVMASGATNVATVTTNGQMTAISLGPATITAKYQGLTASKTISVVTVPAVLAHRYSFGEEAGSTVATDAVGGANGDVLGGATFDGAGSLTLDGASGYVDLPNGIVASLSEVTFEAWVTWTGTRTWERIFDFGDNSAGEDGQGTGLTYLLVTPRASSGFLRFTSTMFSNGAESIVDATSALTAGQERHVAVTYSPGRGVAKLYVNGARVGTGAALVPLSGINDINVWLGRSNWPDPFFTGSFDEFRIYAGFLLESEVAASFAAGPNAPMNVRPQLQISRLGVGYVTIFWPGSAGADYDLEVSPVLGAGAVWTSAGTPVNFAGRYVISLPATATAQFFRLHKP